VGLVRFQAEVVPHLTLHMSSLLAVVAAVSKPSQKAVEVVAVQVVI